MLLMTSGDNDVIRETLQNYYQTQSYLPEGLSGRISPLSESYINLSIVSFQTQKEESIFTEGDEKEEKKELKKEKHKEKGKEKEHQEKEPIDDEEESPEEIPKEKSTSHTFRDERLASYEALHTVKEPIALEALFRPQKETDKSIQKILAVGRAGIGKTTLMRLIASLWGQKKLLTQYRYFFCLPLRNLNQPHYVNDATLTLAKVIYRECCQEDKRISLEELEKILIEHPEEILLGIDGFDEGAELARDLSTPLGQIIQQALAFPQLIVTSRPYLVPTEIKFDRHVEIMGFTPENISAYVKSYFEHPDLQQPQQAELLLSFLKANPNIWGMAHVPINLSLVCNAWDEMQRQGQNFNVRLQLTGLYQNLACYLSRCFLERKGEPIYDKDNAWIEQRCLPQTKILEALAVAGLAKQELILNPELQRSTVERMGASAKAFAEALHLGLLQPVGQAQAEAIDQAHYFLHLTFQEFFAARYMVRGLKKASHTAHHQEALAFIRDHKYDPRYTMVFLFMAGLVSADNRQHRSLQIFWDVLLSGPRDLLGIAHQQLIIRCLEEAQLDKRIAQREQLLGDISQWVRAAAFYDVPSGPLLSVLNQCSKVLHEPITRQLSLPVGDN